jgi:hypothetical protein
MFPGIDPFFFLVTQSVGMKLFIVVSRDLLYFSLASDSCHSHFWFHLFRSKLSSKGLCVTGLVLSLVLLAGDGNFQRWNLLVIGGCALEGARFQLLSENTRS